MGGEYTGYLCHNMGSYETERSMMSVFFPFGEEIYKKGVNAKLMALCVK